ncbi:hypothetical protein OS123_06285 [Corynebacterium sp. P5875]|uniref:Uncharacterized protein n=1 Tax=Corynebacterium antarcticum TaxID=2800405 RepID=A0A9Q4GKQ8_9CORY|nr:hypothetical protein [Corynebacterium antarcticum]MCX7538147.1 hypothetical protein [Corynebacterium antarcticum]
MKINPFQWAMGRKATYRKRGVSDIFINAVNLNSSMLDEINTLGENSRNLAYFANCLFSTEYSILHPEYESWDKQYGTASFPDPFRNALKLQKFNSLSANGILHTASHTSRNSLNEPDSYMYTPFATGVLARSACEMVSGAYRLVEEKEPEKKIAVAASILTRGINDMEWGRKRLDGREELLHTFKNWSDNAKNKTLIPKVRKHNPAEQINRISTLKENPYSFLSDFSHGNPVSVAVSIIDAQEDFGINVQNDFWCLAIAYESSLKLCNLFLEKYPQVKSIDLDRIINTHNTYLEHIEKLKTQSWGRPKEIPDRDSDQN